MGNNRFTLRAIGMNIAPPLYEQQARNIYTSRL